MVQIDCIFDVETGENIITYLHEEKPNNEQAKVTSLVKGWMNI